MIKNPAFSIKRYYWPSSKNLFVHIFTFSMHREERNILTWSQQMRHPIDIFYIYCDFSYCHPTTVFDSRWPSILTIPVMTYGSSYCAVQYRIQRNSIDQKRSGLHPYINMKSKDDIDFKRASPTLGPNRACEFTIYILYIYFTI